MSEAHLNLRFGLALSRFRCSRKMQFSLTMPTIDFSASSDRGGAARPKTVHLRPYSQVVLLYLVPRNLLRFPHLSSFLRYTFVILGRSDAQALDLRLPSEIFSNDIRLKS
jgi:hypothetical protein